MGEKIFMEIFLKIGNISPYVKNKFLGKKVDEPCIIENVKKKIWEIFWEIGELY